MGTNETLFPFFFQYAVLNFCLHLFFLFMFSFFLSVLIKATVPKKGVGFGFGGAFCLPFDVLFLLRFKIFINESALR